MQAKKIVIVDDDENIRKTLFLVLNKKFRVYLACDAQEAIDRFSDARVDLMIVDYRLPRMSGLQLVAALRKGGYRGAAMLISGHPDLVEPEILSRLSIACFFSKPVDLDDLSRSIDYVLFKNDMPERRVF